MKTVECKIRVRYSEVGRQGFAHHANYLNWFDIVQETLIESCGLSYKDIEDLGYFWAPITETCSYIHPACYNDELTVRLSVKDISPIQAKFIYEIIRKKDTKLIATGQTDHVFVDTSFRPYSLKRVIPKLYDILESMK